MKHINFLPYSTTKCGPRLQYETNSTTALYFHCRFHPQQRIGNRYLVTLSPTPKGPPIADCRHKRFFHSTPLNMGGSAFSNQGVLTPRMSPETYHRLKTKYHDILKGLYGYVVTPPEAPGKTSYGDLDYLVAEPILSKKSKLTTMEDVKVAFGAEYMTAIAGATTSFAVPLELEGNSGDLEEGEEKEDGKTYAQIDVHICPSPENMWWVSFKHAYGDLWSILGIMARTKGLVADEKCLNLRIREIEDHNRELAKVELTKSVNETLEFFGLDVGKYERGFGGVKEVYEFLTESRFFEERSFTKKKFANASDRSKIGKRDMFKGWFDFLGVDVILVGKVLEGGQKEAENEDVTDGGKNGESVQEDRAESPEEGITREQVLEEALERFGKREEYEEKVKAWRRNLRVEMVARGVAKKLIDGGHNGPRSARTKSSKLRKQINEGEMDEIFDMTEEQVQMFIQDRVNELIESNANNTVSNTGSEVAAVSGSG
ncbi:hypothetical protein EYR41_001074 [Orbilia oligospora]|uniref:Uncharacterized protein n=2 Tax=Orbilia oligospora TaxID=2813651 RepID=A0A8H2E973_ORBOL|nr:hypothetical protein TWF132_002887 [Orbilia oligospora]TGJ74021.1 hypothetical protein EYR41_001074 [Orbilia oligospora]